MKRFRTTHTIETVSAIIRVMWVEDPSSFEGAALFTHEEWKAHARADWHFDSKDGLTFQGQPFDATLTRLPRRQSLKTALKSEAIRSAARGLVGCRSGHWPSTDQAQRRLIEELPPKAERSYLVDDVIEALLVENAAGRYAWRRRPVSPSPSRRSS